MVVLASARPAVGRFRILFICFGLVFIGGVYLLFFSPVFAGRIADSSLVPHIPQWLRREMADTLIKDGERRDLREDYRGEISRLKQAMKMDTTHPHLWQYFCSAYKGTNELDLALDACQRDAEVDPSALEWGALAGIYVMRKEYSKAIQIYERLIQAGVFPVYGPLIAAHVASGQMEEAVEAAQREVDYGERQNMELRNAILPTALQHLTFAYQQVGDQKKAEETCERLHRLDPGYRCPSCEMEDRGKGVLTLKCF